LTPPRVSSLADVERDVKTRGQFLPQISPDVRSLSPQSFNFSARLSFVQVTSPEPISLALFGLEQASKTQQGGRVTRSGQWKLTILTKVAEEPILSSIDSTSGLFRLKTKIYLAEMKPRLQACSPDAANGYGS
jgi:hypothetical protein